MLTDKVALITGSTSGIGLGIAYSLAERGCHIMLNGFGKPLEIEAVREDIEIKHNVKVRYFGADISHNEEVIELIEEAEAQLGAVDILVNNAGIQHVAPIEDFAVEQWERIMAVNLSAAFYTMRIALPNMKKRGWGRIINIASAHGLRASAGKSAYVAAKHGVIGLTKVVALETVEYDITCNAICPGWVKTPLVEQQVAEWAQRDNISIDEAIKLLLSEKQPSLEFVTPSEIGAMAVYLCGDAAKSVTGASMSIDGGWTAK